jgi:hypothetical protein
MYIEIIRNFVFIVDVIETTVKLYTILYCSVYAILFKNFLIFEDSRISISSKIVRKKTI